MANTQNTSETPLAQAVLNLDGHFTELIRLSEKIENTKLEHDADFEQVQRLMSRFAECAEGVSTGVISMSNALNDARALAETAAVKVAARAEEFQVHQLEREKAAQSFKNLADKVQLLNAAMVTLKQEQMVAQDSAKVSMRLTELELELKPLIEEAEQIKNEAKNAKMSTLEQNALSLKQSLIALTKKLSSLRPSEPLQ
jgi:diphthamide synthase (EF-2-diphthine--ammonia ligase)